MTMSTEKIMFRWRSRHAGIVSGGRGLDLECLGQTCLLPKTCFVFFFAVSCLHEHARESPIPMVMSASGSMSPVGT